MLRDALRLLGTCARVSLYGFCWDPLYIPCVQSFLLKLEELTGIWTMKNVVAEWIHFTLFGIITLFGAYERSN